MPINDPFHQYTVKFGSVLVSVIFIKRNHLRQLYMPLYVVGTASLMKIQEMDWNGLCIISKIGKGLHIG